MKRTCSRLAVVLWLWAPQASILADQPLPIDERIRAGKLENGVTWLYRQHDNPPGKMALMMHVRTGSLNEKDSQRGLAHFLEHMCFNGSENFPPGALIPYFESIGMEFGADLNASTSFDATRYMLFTPNTDKEQIEKALMVLSDYAFRATLPAEEIDKERGVVLEEARSGKSAEQRVRDKLWPELFEGSRFAKRLPIGDEKVIATAPRSEFEDYYRAWYRPENVTVVLVGDAPADGVVPLIEKWFGRQKTEGKAPEPMKAEFKPFTKERTFVVTDPELTTCQVQMMNLGPGRPPATTVEAWRVELVENIASWIMARRFDERRRKGEGHYRSARTSISDFFHEAMTATAAASGEAKDWTKMLDELALEVNRARAYGFTKRELELARRELKAGAERAVRTEPTRNARGLAMSMVSAVNDRVPILSAEQELQLYEGLLPTIQIAEVNRAFSEHFKPGAFAFVVTMPEKQEAAAPSPAEVTSAARAALAQKPEAPIEEETPTEFLAGLPSPGQVAETTKDKDLDVTHLWLENGVRVHHRYMDYKRDLIIVNISLAGGEIEEKAGNRGVTQVAALAVNDAATHRLTSTHVRDIIVGKNIRVSAGSGDDALVVRINGSPRDLEAGLQLAYAVLTDGIIEEQALESWKLRTRQQIDRLEKEPRFWAGDAVADFIAGGDARGKFLKKEQVEALSVSEGQAWFERLCREAPIEVSIVGDARLEQVQPLVLRYLGSLPQRKRTVEHLAPLRKSERKPGPRHRRIEVQTITPKAQAMVGFVGCAGKDVADDRALQVAEHILRSRLVKRIREDLALVYSIEMFNEASWAYEDAGRFQAGASCDPENSAKVAKEIEDIFTEFVEVGPSDAELDNAKRQIEDNLDTGMREPSWWSEVLRQLDFHGRSLEEEKKHKEAFRKITIEEVQTAVKKYYKPERSYQVMAVPVRPPEPETKEGEGADSTSQPAP